MAGFPNTPSVGQTHTVGTITLEAVGQLTIMEMLIII